MNQAAPKLQPLTATPPKTMGTQGQGLKPPAVGQNQQPGGPPRGNAELVLKPSKTNPRIKRWQKAHEDQPEPKQPKTQDQPAGKPPKQEVRPDFKVGDRIAFQTKDQRGSADFTYGKIQEESDTFYGIVDDQGNKHSLPKQAARTPKQVTEAKSEEKQTAEKEGRDVKTSQPRSKEVDIKVGAGDKVEKGLLLENGDLWQAVNVGSYVDYVKLGNVYNNATVAMKVGSHLGVVNEDGKSDVIHKSDVINVGKGTNREQVDQFNKRLEKHLKRVEKKLDKLHLDNQNLRKRLKKVAAQKGTTPEAEEKLNQQIVKEREKRKAVEQKLHDLTIKHALKEERRLRDLATLQQRLKEQKTRAQKPTISQETKTKLDAKIEEYEKKIQKLEADVQFQSTLRTTDKETLAKLESGRIDYKKQLQEFQKEIDSLIHQNYDAILEEKKRRKLKKAKYDFSNLDFDSINIDHAIDIMFADELPTIGSSKKEKEKYAVKVAEARRLFKSKPSAFFDRMLNYAKRHSSGEDDLGALNKVFGEWMNQRPTDEHWEGRIQVLQEGDENIYDAFGPDDNEIERELETRNQPVIDKAMADLGLDDKKLSEVKAGSTEYEKLVDHMTNLLLAHGQTRAELANEFLKPRTPQKTEGEAPEPPAGDQEPPEALYDPEEPFYPQESDYDSLEWHDDSANEFMDLMSKEEGEFFHKLERDEQGNFRPEFIETFIEDNPEMTAKDYEEMEPILNAVYAESNKGYETERVAQAHSEVMATAQIISDRIIKKAGMKNKAQAEVEKLKEKVSAKEREFLDKYLYGIKKAFVWFGRLITMRKSQQSLSLDAPAKMPRYVRATVTRQPLHFANKGDMVLLPSKKNPRVRRWQDVNPDEKKEKTLSLFDQPEKKEKKKEILKDDYKSDGGWWDFAETVAMEHAKVIKQTHSNETVLRPRPATVRKIAQNLGISQTDVDRGLTIFNAPDTKYEIAHHRKTKPDAPKIEAKPEKENNTLKVLLDEASKYKNANDFVKDIFKKQYSDIESEHIKHQHFKLTIMPINQILAKDGPRITKNDKRVAHWKKEISNGSRPPIVGHFSGSRLDLTDGFHKLRAYRDLGMSDIPALAGKWDFDHNNNQFDEIDDLYQMIDKPSPQQKQPWEMTLYRGVSNDPPADEGQYGKGQYWSSSIEEARIYGGENTKKAKIKLNNPYIVDWKDASNIDTKRLIRNYGKHDPKEAEELSKQIREKLEKQGYDGIVINHGSNKEVVVFHPELQDEQKLYHGTTENFRQFDPAKAGSHIPDFLSLLGTHYTPNKEVAQSFAGKSGKVIESNFSPKKPLKIKENDLVRQIATFAVDNGMIDLDRAKESAEFRSVKAKLGSKQDLLNFINKASYEDLRRVIYPQIDRKQGQKIVDAYAQKHLKDYDSIQYLNEVEKPEEKRYDLIELKKSFNLIKGHRIPQKYTFQGLPISIETPKGKTRSGVDPDGSEWETKMKYDYGYVRLTEGVDGDHLDCYVGPDKKSKTVFIVHQNSPDTGKYDEDKVFLGFNSADEVKKVFLQHYDDPGFWGSMTQMPMKDFKKFIEKKKNKGKPVAFDPKNVAKKAIIFKGKKYFIKAA